MSRRHAPLLVAGALALVLSACSAGETAPDAVDPGAPGSTSASDPATSAPSSPPASEDSHDTSGPPAKPLPLRAGERRVTMTMPAAYTPASPTGAGTDDYRCFLLDPELARDSYLTGTHVLPGNPDVVHHVILFRITPEQVGDAELVDQQTPGEGWTCFGGTGLASDFSNVDDANWLAAWAPGGQERMVKKGFGVDLPAGSRIVMQVHYNLLAGAEPDTSSTQLRITAKRPGVTELHTFLMPAPVEMPCRPGRDSSPLCDREAAIADERARIGPEGGWTANALHILCNTVPTPSDVTTCTRTLNRGMTIYGVAGHMHLLGRHITMTTDAGTPRERTILDIKPWDFDNQGSTPIEPVRLAAGDTVTVTCEHKQWLRDRLPAFETQREDKYVIWGEGTTDEMCLGMLSVSFEE